MPERCMTAWDMREIWVSYLYKPEICLRYAWDICEICPLICLGYVRDIPKIWNVDYFDIVAPPLTLTKTVPNSHQTDTWGLFHSYIGHICTKCSIYLTNISPIYHKSQGHISVIWIWEKCEKFRPPPLVKIVYIWNVDYFDFGFDPPPPFGLFPQFVRFFFGLLP